MVNIKKLFLISSVIYITGCDNDGNINKLDDKGKGEVSMNIVTDMEKHDFDNSYLEEIEKLEFTDKEYLNLIYYVIKCYKNNKFKEVDPILGEKSEVYFKTYENGKKQYSYYNIPGFPGIRITLIYKNKEIELLSFGKDVDGGDFLFKKTGVNILKELNLKFIGMESFYFSNKLYTFFYTDSNFSYEITAILNDKYDKYPDEFYSFLIRKK